MEMLTSQDYCYLGLHNGTWPNGTVGGGTWQFGHYVPTSMESSMCQKGHHPWGASIEYGFWTIYLVIAFFSACAIVNHLNRLESLSRSLALPSFFAIPSKIKAFLRAVDTPRFGRYLPPLGSVLVYIGLGIFGLAVCFGIRPYYRPPNFGSSPLGLRAEWIATPLIVWIFATGVKRNALGYLTGLNYSRLMDLHKTFGWMCFFFAIVHTVAMVVRADRQSPWSYTWASEPLSYGWAAWGALISLGWLCVMSLGPVRRLSHEFFYVLHMVGVVLFIVFMYEHCTGALNSWSYLHASVVVLGTALIYRFLVVAVRTHGFTRVHRAEISPVEDGALKITIPVGSMEWSAGQHVFIRFLTVYPWQTHPFTILNLPNSPFSASPSEPNSLQFVLHPRTGLTARLASLAASNPTRSLPVHIDGPYGHAAIETIGGADHALLVAGGTGMSFVLPILSALLRGDAPSRVRSLECVWVIPREEALGWYREALDEVLSLAARALTRIDLKLVMHISGSTSVKELADVGSKKESVGSGIKLSVVAGRPDAAGLVERQARGREGCLAVVSCGPASLLQDVRNAVARAQVGILSGKVKVDEVTLCEELYEC
ncbi:hypothetical protein JCM5296_000515 [Sporobolomyces johnsonii]